jgi:hypothetical protein
MRESFIGIQNTIEAIDRAIAHERLLAIEPTVSASKTIPQSSRLAEFGGR